MSVKSSFNTILAKLSFYSQLCFIILFGAIIITSILQWMLFPSEIMAGSTQLVNGSLINRGAVIHRDFWSKETPLVFYLHSWAFQILGESVIASKIIGIIIFVCMLIGFYCYYRGHQHSWLTVTFLTLLSGYFLLFNLMQTKWIAYAVSFLAFTVYLISCQAKNCDRAQKADIMLVFSGILTGLAILAKLNCGGYVFLGVCCGLLSDLLFSDRHKYHLQRLIYFALPVVSSLGLYLLVHLDHLPALIDQVIVFPGSKLGQHRIISLANTDNSWGELLEEFWAVYLTLIFPLIWFHLQLVKLPKSIRRQTFISLYIAIAIAPLLFIAEFQAPSILPKLFILPLLGVIICQLISPIEPPQFTTLCTYSLFLHYFLSRTDANHYSPLFFFILILVVDALFNHHNYKFPQIYFYGLVILLTYYQFAIPWDEIGEKLLDGDRIANSARVFQLKDTLLAKGDAQFLMSADLPLSKPEAKLYDNQDELAALQLIYQNTNKDDYIYVGVTDHARVYISNIRPYWELGRKIGVVNYILEPGLTTEKKVQSQMIAQLKENKVRWILLWEQPKPEEDFRARNYQGSDLLDRYIQQNYSLVKQFEEYFVYRQAA